MLKPVVFAAAFKEHFFLGTSFFLVDVKSRNAMKKSEINEPFYSSYVFYIQG